MMDALTTIACACGLYWMGRRSLARNSRWACLSNPDNKAKSRIFSLVNGACRPRPMEAELVLWPEAIRQLAALLRAGAPTQRVWLELAESRAAGPAHVTDGDSSRVQKDITSVVEQTARAAGAGMNPMRALESVKLGSTASRQIIDTLVAAWTVSQQTGASLAEVLERIAEAVEDDLDAWAAREAALAGPRATARILSALPIVGLGLGALMGTDPLGILIGQVWGQAALAAGITLGFIGMVWSRRLVLMAQGEHSQQPFLAHLSGLLAWKPGALARAARELLGPRRWNP